MGGAAQQAINLGHNAILGASVRTTRWHVLAAGFLCYGFDAMDFMMLALSLAAISAEFHLSLGAAGLLGTAGMIGVGLSSLLFGWYADNYGRRRVLLVAVTVFALFTAAAYWARGWSDLLALRFCAGLGLGGVWGVVSALINEVWPHETRGRAIAFVLSSWPVGLIAAAIIARAVLPHHSWRLLFLLGGSALLAVVYVWFMVPESATWRAQREAMRRAAAERGSGNGSDGRVAISEIFAPGLARRTWLGTLVAACALTGYWGVNSWLPTYLVSARGLSAASMASFIIMLNLGMFAGYQLFGVVADLVGLRRSLLICFVGAAILLPVYASIHEPRWLFWSGPVLGLFFAYTGPFGAYFPQLFPTRVRSMGAGFCFNVGRGIAAFAPYAFGELATSIGLAASIGWCAVGFLLAALVMCLMPDL